MTKEGEKGKKEGLPKLAQVYEVEKLARRHIDEGMRSLGLERTGIKIGKDGAVSIRYERKLKDEKQEK